jgi:hypothetical protein
LNGKNKMAEHLDTGVYFVRILNASGFQMSGKLAM